MNRISVTFPEHCNPCRITTSYKEGSGDTGRTLGYQTKVGKALVSDLYADLETLRLHIQRAIAEADGIESEYLQTLFWFANNTFSIGALIHLNDAKDETQSPHRLPDEFLPYMEQRIQEWKEEVGSAPDFINWVSEPFISLDQVRVSARRFEGRFTAWREGRENAGNEKLAKVLNRFSSYVFWGNRALAKLQNTQEIYWQGSVSQFPFA